MANFPNASSVIPDKIQTDDLPKVLRNIYTQIARNVASQDRVIQNLFPGVGKDNDLTHMRVAHALKGMAHNIEIIDPGTGIIGDVLYLVDPYHAQFGSAANPGSGGTTPSVGSNALLDGVYHTDTLAAAVARGALIVGNSTPKWSRLVIGAANTSLISNGTDASWGNPVAAGGWQDDGTVVRLITSTDQVGIGTVTPGASFAVVNVNNVADVIAKLTAKASQTGDMLELIASTGRVMASFDKTGSIFVLGSGNAADIAINSILVMGGGDQTGAAASGTYHAVITWAQNQNALSNPTCTADMIGCNGARFYPYKDVTGQYDCAYGQSLTEAWVICGPEDTPYAFYSGRLPASGTPFYRVTWAGNGDMTNYGYIHSRKSISALSKGTPGIRLEETGSGTDYIAVQAPAAVAAGNRVQTLMDLTGVIPVVGDDPPAVASKALGKVDTTAIAAAIASTNLTNGATAGMYLLDWTLLVTMADATAGTFQLSVAYTDTLGATTQTSGVATTLIATSRASGQMVIQLASGEIAYTGVLTGAFNAARAALYIRVMFLG